MSDERYINDTLFFSTKVAANRLGITPAQVRKRCQDGTLNAQKVGNAWFVELPSAAPTVKKVSKVAKIKKEEPRVPSRLVSTIASVLPAKPMAQLPVAYAKSLPMVIGVVVSIALFFVGTLPFMSDSLASVSNIQRPMQALGNTVGGGYEHFVRKTDELLEHSSLSLALGVGALRSTITERASAIQTNQEPRVISMRMSSLVRSLSQTSRIPVGIPVAEGVQGFAAAAASLYHFERLTETSAPFTEDATWGCVLGVSSCTTSEPAQIPQGVSVLDARTNTVHCVQVVDGQPVSTPGRCAGDTQ